MSKVWHSPELKSQIRNSSFGVDRNALSGTDGAYRILGQRVQLKVAQPFTSRFQR